MYKIGNGVSIIQGMLCCVAVIKGGTIDFMSGKQRGIEKKLVAEAAKEKKKAEDEERKLAQEWSVGTKENSKLKDQEQKEAERRRLAAEKSALEAREEAEASGNFFFNI